MAPSTWPSSRTNSSTGDDVRAVPHRHERAGQVHAAGCGIVRLGPGGDGGTRGGLPDHGTGVFLQRQVREEPGRRDRGTVRPAPAASRPGLRHRAIPTPCRALRRRAGRRISRRGRGSVTVMMFQVARPVQLEASDLAARGDGLVTRWLTIYRDNLQTSGRQLREVQYQCGGPLQGMVNNVLIFTAPGQGAQTPGFLSPWLEIPGLAEQFGSWSELAGRDLIGLGTTGSAEEITDTSVAQPLLVAAALAVAGLLGEPDAAAGHSVGELAAGAIAGVLTANDAIRLTRARGEAMAASCGATPTGMTAVLGGDEAAVLGAIAEAGLTPANINGAGQIVAGGTLEQLAEFAANPPKGARLRPLRVAGAFHTKHMAPAVDALEAAAAGTTVKDPVSYTHLRAH